MVGKHLTVWLSIAMRQHRDHSPVRGDVGPALAALADPTRRRIVERLAHGEATVGELAAPHPMSLPAFTKHLGVLERAGIVRRRRAGRTVVCSLEPAPLAALGGWATDMTTYWSATIDRLERVVTEEDA